MKILPVGAELFHADGTTDRHDEDNSRFSQFCKRAYKLDKESFSSEFSWNHLYCNIKQVLLSRDIRCDIGVEYHSVTLVLI